MLRPLTLVLAEQDPSLLALVRSALAGKVKEIAVVRSGWELLALLVSRTFDLVICGARMGEPGGTRSLTMARQLGHQVPFVVILSFSDPEARLRTRAMGGELLDGDFSEADLIAAIEALTDRPA